MPYVVNASEWLELNSVPLATPAWMVENLPVMWSGPETRGTDRVIPGSAGVLPKPRRAAVTPVQLEMAVFAGMDWEGNPNTDTRAGLWANVKHLRDNVTDPTGLGDGTLSATLYLPDGTTQSGAVHVERFEVGVGGVDWVPAVLRLTVVAGALAEVGS